MNIKLTGLVVLLSVFYAEAKPGGIYTLTGDEKSIAEIIKADMEQFPELYKGETLNSYISKFKRENKIGKSKLSPGDQLRFPETLASIQAKKPKPEENASTKPAMPSDILDLSRWKLTLPYPSGGEATDIFQSELDTFERNDCFFVDHSVSGVVFRAHCAGATTRNSKYPRCELREMTKSASQRADWSNSDRDIHRMTIHQAITAVPPVKKHVVAGQIHDADDDVVMILLQNRKLSVSRNKFEKVVLDENYQLGTPFRIKIEAYDGHIKIWYDGTLMMDWEYTAYGCYFKAGCYTQSNTSKGDEPESYGEVVIYDLNVEHVRPARDK